MNSFRHLSAILIGSFILCTAPVIAQDTAAACKIDVTVKPFQNQWIYLACYYGNIKSLTDSAWVDSNGKGAFKRKEALPQGVYMVVSPQKSILFELMMGPDQVFSVQADTLDIESSLRISGSTDNDLFVDYSKYLSVLVKSADSIQQQMKTAAPADQAKYNARMQQLNGDILSYREKVVNDHPDAMLSLLFRTLSMVQYPPELAKPVSKNDSLAQYRYGKEHYWDGIDFMDGRLVRTPVFENKLNDYLENWVAPQADSVIFEFNWMIALGRNDDEMYKYLISYFVDHYMYPKIMGQDKVFLHVYEQYLSGEHPKVNWLNARQMKIINDRALMLMANQLGAKGYNMNLPDTLGTMRSLYQVKAKYTVVAFWDVHCGKCREELPRMDSLYQQKWKKKDVKIFAVMVNESSLADWPSYIRSHAAGWIHVHQPTSMREAEEKNNQPNFRQLYDMRSTPTLYLLDANKMIVAKNVSLEDLDKLLDLKLAQ